MWELKPNRKLFPDYLSFILHGVRVGGWFTLARSLEEFIFHFGHGVGKGGSCRLATYHAIPFCHLFLGNGGA
jgi:hypothetical protein